MQACGGTERDPRCFGQNELRNILPRAARQQGERPSKTCHKMLCSERGCVYEKGGSARGLLRGCRAAWCTLGSGRARSRDNSHGTHTDAHRHLLSCRAHRSQRHAPTLMDPADWPKMVTVLGSPPKPPMLSRTCAEEGGGHQRRATGEEGGVAEVTVGGVWGREGGRGASSDHSEGREGATTALAGPSQARKYPRPPRRERTHSMAAFWSRRPMLPLRPKPPSSWPVTRKPRAPRR